MTNGFRQLPGVDALLRAAPELEATYGHGRAVQAIREALDEARTQHGKGGSLPTPGDLLVRIRALIDVKDHPRRVINATGVIIHTNLGRAPLSEAAQQAMIDVAAGYSALEYDLEIGTRGKREQSIEALITEITGAEAAAVVNNNAAATLLILSATAQGREVILSRGELVEIGGGFRVPDIMAQSGARLVEVGTTNRTRIADYERAITPQTALLMRVHSSNFKMIGFTEQPTLGEIADLAHARGLLAVEDLGSGALLDTTPFGLEHEPTVGESLAAGFDVVAFSGDKLLGGPQAGIIAGRRDVIEGIKRHPLARAVRIDKLCLAALTTTLEHYRYGEALTHIPVWKMIAMPPATIRARAEVWAEQVGGQVIEARSTIGGGSLPGEMLSTFTLGIEAVHPDQVMARLRRTNPPVIARIGDGRLLFDPRTVFLTQDERLLAAIRDVMRTPV